MGERVAAQPQKTLSLQHTSAQSVLLQRKCGCGSGGSAGLTGSCDDCGRKRLLGLQPKLEVGEPGDSFEREADRVAEEVLRETPHAAQQPSAAPSVQRKTVTPVGSASAAGTVSAPSVVHEVLGSAGQPLDASTRSFMESRFGHDFSRVRVHTDTRAAESAQSVDATAYTVGHNVVFAEGHYAPRTDAGRRLLAHELTHVLQQRVAPAGGSASSASGIAQRQAAGGVVLQRQPAPTTRKVRILSLDEIKTDPKRQAALKLSGLVEAKVCRDISVPFTSQKCPTALKPNTEISIVGSAAGGTWLKMSGAGLPGFGEKEQVFVPNVFAKDVPVAAAPEKPKAAPVAAEKPKEEPATKPETKEDALLRQLKKRLEGIPEKKKWTGHTKGKSSTAITFAIVAKDFWFNEPTDREAATTIIGIIKKNFSDVHLTDSNFDKRFKDLSGFSRIPLRNFLLDARSSFERLKSLTIPGNGQSEATWEHQLTRMKSAYEVMEVLAGDLEAKESKNIKALDDAMSLKPATAFLDGLLEGFKSQLSDEDYKVLAAKLAGSQVVSFFAPPIILSGATVGIAKDIGEAFKGVYEMLDKPAEMAANMAQMMSALLFDEEGARVMGQAMGVEHGKEIHKLAGENLVKFTYKLGELIGPTVVYTILSIVSAGAIAGAAVSARLSKFLIKFPKAAKTIDRIKDLMPKRRALKAAEKAAEEAGDVKAAAGKAKALRTDVPDAPDKPKATHGDAPDKPKAADPLKGLGEENAKLFERRPELKKALDENPRAARAMKLCNSPCFPEFATPAQVKRIEKFLERAEKSGWDIDQRKLREYFHRAKTDVDLTEHIDELEEAFRRIKESKGSAAMEAVLDETELLEQPGVRQKKPTDIRLAEAKEGNVFDEKMVRAYPHNQVPIRDKTGKLRRLDSYDPVRGEIVSRKSFSASQNQMALADPDWVINYYQEFPTKYPNGAAISAKTGPLAGQKLVGKYVLEVPVQKMPIPERLLKEAKARGITIRDHKGTVYQ